MSLKQKPESIISYVEATGVSTSKTFQVPNTDFNNITFKLSCTLTGTSPTDDVYIQTSDDGGTTWYDMAHFAQLTTSITAANALWLSCGTYGFGGTNNAAAGYTGPAADATIAASRVSGLPLLGGLIRIKHVYGGTIGTASVSVTGYVNNQDSR